MFTSDIDISYNVEVNVTQFRIKVSFNIGNLFSLKDILERIGQVTPLGEAERLNRFYFNQVELQNEFVALPIINVACVYKGYNLA